MNISPVTSNQYFLKSNNKQTSFTSWPSMPIMYRDIHGVERMSQVCTDLRNDLNYKTLAKMLKTFLSIKDGVNQKWDKVKIYCLAGADGTEAYAIAEGLIGQFGFEKTKEIFFPIRVSDIHDNTIKNFGKSGKVYFGDYEIDKLPNIRNFLIKENNHFANKTLYSLKPEFRECFIFETADLQEKIENIPAPQDKEFTLFVIRNVFHQSGINAVKCINKLREKCPPPNSAIILGGYDIKNSNIYNEKIGLKYLANNTFLITKPEFFSFG